MWHPKQATSYLDEHTKGASLVQGGYGCVLSGQRATIGTTNSTDVNRDSTLIFKNMYYQLLVLSRRARGINVLFGFGYNVGLPRPFPLTQNSVQKRRQLCIYT